VYWPNGDGPFPVILYIHGGGWVIANLDTYDGSARGLTNAAKAVVVSTHYRQAPEHKYPAAHDDVFAAYQWTIKNAASLKGDPGRIAVAGESAGGNMAAVVSIRARDQKIAMPVHQLLVYPVAGSDTNTESYRENANAKPLNKPMMEWFAKHALSKSENKDPRIDLVHADLEGLAPGLQATTTLIESCASCRGRSYDDVLGNALGAQPSPPAR
jgi:acetyl esterase/lipase